MWQNFYRTFIRTEAIDEKKNILLMFGLLLHFGARGVGAVLTLPIPLAVPLELEVSVSSLLRLENDD